MRISLLRTGLQAVEELCFPLCCPACGRKLLPTEEVICLDCLNALPRTEHASMPDNGIDMLFGQLTKEYGHIIHYVRGAAFGFYNRRRGKILRQLIEQGKFGLHPRPEIFETLGKEAARDYVAADLFESVDLLVPMPLHPKRLRQRGFNQAELICRGLNAITGIHVDNTHLIRVRNNPHQSHAQFRDRMHNVENIFAIRYPEEWKGKHILLVDDVITSGATMLECMKQMTPIRGNQISVFALGWAHN